MRAAALALLALATACRAVLGIPEGELAGADAAVGRDAAADAAQAVDAWPLEAEAACDYADDDDDGLIDEGYVYVEDPSVRRTIDAGSYAGVWWMGRSDDRIAVVWVTGEGNAGDVVSVRIFDFAGEPVAPAVTTSVGQPWTMARGWWVGDRFVIAGTQRDYACGGTNSVACPTYLLAVDRDGQMVLEPTLVATDTPVVTGAYEYAGAYHAAFVPGGGVGEVRLRSYTPAGEPTGVDVALFATDLGESLFGVRALRAGDTVYWTYLSSTTGTTLRVSDPSGAEVSGPITLSSSVLNLASRGFDHMIEVDGEVQAAFEVDGQVSVGRWTFAGAPLGAPLVLTGATGLHAMSDGFGQSFVLTRLTGDDTPRVYIWRLARDGRVAQPGAAIEIPQDQQYAALVGLPTGIAVAIASYGAGNRPITFTRFGCP